MLEPTAKKTEPLQTGTEQQKRLDTAMARIQEARLRIKGNPRCTLGCSGRGYIGIRTLPMTDGGWDLYLEPCKCSKKSEYAELKDHIDAQLRTLGNLIVQLNEIQYRNSFFGGIKTGWQRLISLFKRTFARKITIDPKSP